MVLGVERIATDVENGSGIIYVEPGYWSKQVIDTRGAAYRHKVNEIFDDHDIAWQLVGREMVSRTSIAMHATVVEPLMKLTNGEPKYAAVESAYTSALLRRHHEPETMYQYGSSCSGSASSASGSCRSSHGI